MLSTAHIRITDLEQKMTKEPKRDPAAPSSFPSLPSVQRIDARIRPAVT
jgi:hypothetical protein